MATIGWLAGLSRVAAASAPQTNDAAPAASSSASGGAPAAPPAPVFAPSRASKPQPLATSLPPDARADYQAGRLLFEDGDYATALIKFREAREKASDPRLLWNEAACLKNMRRYAKALAALRQYTAEGAARLTPKDRRDAAELANAIESFTVALNLKISEPGAEVTLDDENVGPSPIVKPITVDIGMRKIQVRKPGFRAVEKEIPVGGNRTVTVEIKLEKEGGHLDIRVPANATIVIDEAVAGHGPLLGKDLAVGGHTLRITAPKMRPYQGEVYVEHGKARALEYELEPEAEQRAELRIAVGCGDPAPRAQAQGLTVFLDGERESASLLGGRTRIQDDQEVVAYTPTLVAPGAHRVRVHLPRCVSQEVETNLDAGSPVTVTGMLAPVNPWLNGSPAGSPDGYRFGLGVVQSSLTLPIDRILNVHGADAFPISAGANMAGAMATAALQGRWLTLAGDVRYQAGSASLPAPATSGDPGNVNQGALAGSRQVSVSQFDVSVRPGFRFPLYFGALSFGLGAQLGSYRVAADALGSKVDVVGAFLFWSAIDIKPLCDWDLQIGAVGQTADYSGSAATSSSFFVQANYEPNAICTRRRTGQYRLYGAKD